MANGHHFNPEAAVCAHRSLPFGTVLALTNRANGRKARCTVSDRGPYIRGRVLDVSKGIARQLGMLQAGVTNVEFHIVGHQPKR